MTGEETIGLLSLQRLLHTSSIDPSTSSLYSVSVKDQTLIISKLFLLQTKSCNQANKRAHFDDIVILCFNRRMMVLWSWMSTVTYILHLYYCINSVHRVHLLNWKNELKKSSDGKKDVAKSVHEACCLRIQIRTLKATTWWTFWNCMIFPQTICYIVPYAQDLLPIKFFFSSFTLNVP